MDLDRFVVGLDMRTGQRVRLSLREIMGELPDYIYVSQTPEDWAEEEPKAWVGTRAHEFVEAHPVSSIPRMSEYMPELSMPSTPVPPTPAPTPTRYITQPYAYVAKAEAEQFRHPGWTLAAAALMLLGVIGVAWLVSVFN